MSTLNSTETRVGIALLSVEVRNTRYKYLPRVITCLGMTISHCFGTSNKQNNDNHKINLSSEPSNVNLRRLRLSLFSLECLPTTFLDFSRRRVRQHDEPCQDVSILSLTSTRGKPCKCLNMSLSSWNRAFQPPPHLPYVQGWPGILGVEPERKAPALHGVSSAGSFTRSHSKVGKCIHIRRKIPQTLELRVGSHQIKCKMILIELVRIEVLPGSGKPDVYQPFDIVREGAHLCLMVCV